MGTITLPDIDLTADYVVNLSERLYKRSRDEQAYDRANDHRQSCLDNLEGLKSLLIQTGNHETSTYQYVCQHWNTVLNWP